MTRRSILAIILAVAVANSINKTTCEPPNPNTFYPSCNEGAKEKVDEDQCCPSCCKNEQGFCEPLCGVEACLPTSWSRGYTRNNDRRSFMIVVQRPLAWDTPRSCKCHVQQTPTVRLSEEPSKRLDGNDSGFEESSSRLRQKERAMHKCCTPPVNHEWRTRNLLCVFDSPCQEPFITLQRDNGMAEAVRIEIVPDMARPDGKGGALLCAPRASRKLVTSHLASGHLREWLQHHGERDFTHALLYSDDCTGSKVLSPSILETILKAKSALKTVTVVDLSSSRDRPVWYHNQLLAMRDCWARGVAGGAAWSVCLDLDEFLVVPTAWSESHAFASAPALSFATLNPCLPSAASLKGACMPTWHGHRKYALRATPQQHAGHSVSLRPPGYIHGDPLEWSLSVSSGMLVLHFSRCPLAPFAAAAGNGSWQERVFQEKKWFIANPADLQKNTELAQCPSPAWIYD